MFAGGYLGGQGGGARPKALGGPTTIAQGLQNCKQVSLHDQMADVSSHNSLQGGTGYIYIWDCTENKGPV